MEIMKTIEFQLRIITNHESRRIPHEKHKNHENPRIEFKNQENRENNGIPYDNHENL